MKLVVGLGNPGAEYRETRHNVGFLVVDELGRRWGVEQWREAFEGLAAKTTRAGEAVLLVKPLTFMNLSGRCVAGLAGFYKVAPADVLVVTDDAALPLGRLRARRGGSAGGHNGLKSVAQSLGTEEYPRLRVGVGRGDVMGADGRVLGRPGMADHVLGRFRPDERDVMTAAILRAADASETFVAEGIERVMNAFNAGTKDGSQESEPAR
ncbi:MAG: aminoacyl-tRNA hydrolase [Vicinamibacterales bacterium]